MKARAWGEASQPGRYCHSTWGVIWARLTAVLLPEASCQWESKGVNAELPPPSPPGGWGLTQREPLQNSTFSTRALYPDGEVMGAWPARKLPL